MNEQIRAAYALNLWTVSVAQIVDYNDVYVLEQEYNNIMNNLNLEHMPKDEALLDIIKKILEEITNLRMDEGDRQMLEKRYQHQLKNAVWSAIPSVGAIFATDNPLALGITLATQVGIGYMNYRRNKAEYKIGNEETQWEIQKHRMMHLHGLQNELFETAWRVADKYKFPDEYRLSANQIKQFNQALMENNPVKRYNKLDSMKHNFAAYPAFWYHIGSTANNLFRSKQFEGDTDSQWYYRSCAVECFAKYKELNQFNLLRHDVMTASWALEYLELLDLNHENNCANARELIEIAERHSGNELDVLELCAFAYLRIRDSKNAARLFHVLVNNGYNEEINAQILSGLYIKQMRSENTEEALEARIHYRQLPHITDTKYILEIPPSEIDFSDWVPGWVHKELFDGFVENRASFSGKNNVPDVTVDTSVETESVQVHEATDMRKRDSILLCGLDTLKLKNSALFTTAKELTKKEIWNVLLQMASVDEKEEDVLGILDGDPFHALNDKHSGILFMREGFYFKNNDFSKPKYMAYSDIISVEEKYFRLIIKGKNQTIEMKSAVFAQSELTKIFQDMRDIYRQ